MKRILLSIPDYMYEWIQEWQPRIASTVTGTIIQLLDHGMNYEVKKYIQGMKRKQQLKELEANAIPNSATVDQENNNEKDKIAQEHGFKSFEEMAAILKTKTY